MVAAFFLFVRIDLVVRITSGFFVIRDLVCLVLLFLTRCGCPCSECMAKCVSRLCHSVCHTIGFYIGPRWGIYRSMVLLPYYWPKMGHRSIFLRPYCPFRYMYGFTSLLLDQDGA
jgi:hypothetical protein